MQAAKGKKLANLLALLLAVVIATPAAASIPRDTLLEPDPLALLAAVDEAPELAAPAVPTVRFIPLEDQLRHRFELLPDTALDRLIYGAEPQQLHLFAEPETRVRASRFLGSEQHQADQRLTWQIVVGECVGPNLYQYALNNPASFSDPLGLLCVGKLKNTRPCRAITEGLTYFWFGDLEGQDQHEEFVWQQRLAFFRAFGEWPEHGDELYWDEANGRMLRADGRWHDYSGRIEANHHELLLVGGGAGAAHAFRAARLAGASVPRQLVAVSGAVADEVAGEVVGVNPSSARGLLPTSGRARGPFLPESYYDDRLNRLAPGQSSPYARYERFDADGNLKQVTTYDQFGDRARQYDLGPEARHGEGYHTFEYGPENPRQAPGGGRRSPQQPFDEEH